MLKRTALAGLGLVLLVSPLLASADTLSDLQAQISQLLAQIKSLQERVNQAPATSSTYNSETSSCVALTYSLSLDDTDSETNGDVSKLQKFLAQDMSIYPEGQISGFFGPATLRAVQRWQSSHGLVSSGNPDTTGYGYVGPKTRGAMAKGCGNVAKPTQPAQPTTPPLSCPLTMSIVRCEAGARAGGWCNQECIPDNDTGAFSASPTYGVAPLQVEFNASASSDQGALTMDFGDGTLTYFEKGINGKFYHTYQSSGTYVATLTQQPSSNCPEASYCAQMVPAKKIIGTAKINVTDSSSNRGEPVVNGIDGPASLGAGQVGKWTVRATVPNQPGAQLSYSVQWGDDMGLVSMSSSQANSSLQTYGTFTHTYKYEGVYKPKFTVSNNYGSAGAETMVSVGQSSVSVLYEQVKCVFNGATTAQKCYTATDSGNSYYGLGCSGVGTCVVDVKGNKGDSVMWKSSCGGYAYTTMDGQSEYANFSCGTTSSAGTLTIETDPTTPKYTIVSGGSTGVELGTFKFHAAGESITLNKIGLILSTDSAYSGDLTKIFLYNSNGSIIGTTVFVGNGNTATVALSQPITIQKDTDVRIRIGGEIARIGTGQSGRAGDLVRVLVTSASGTGGSSGMLISAGQLNSGPDTIAGVRIFRSYPVVAQVPLPSSGLVDGRLMRFSVTASPSGDIGLAEIAVRISGLAANTNGQVDLYGYTDSGYSSPIAGFVAGGINGLPVTSASAGGYLWFPKPVEIPAGQTYYFELRDSTKGTGMISSSGSITTTLLGQSVYAGLVPATSLNGKDVMFVWSPNDMTWSQFSDSDWTNGYGVEGLLTGGISQTRTSGGGVPIANNSRLTVTAPPSAIVGSSYLIQWGGLSGPTLAELARTYPTALGEMIAYNSDQSLGVAQTIFRDVPIGILLNGNITWKVGTLTNDGRQLPSGKYSIAFYVSVPNGGNSTAIAQGNSEPFTLTSGGTTSSSITVTAPNGGEQWEIGQLNTITWSPYGYNPDVNPSSDVKAYLEKKAGDGFNSVYEIIPSGKASIHWEGQVRDMVTNEVTYPAPGQYYVHVINNKTWVGDWSDAPFTLLPRSIDVKVNGSDGPVTLYDNQPITISFTSTMSFKSCYLSGVRQSPNGQVGFDVGVGGPFSGYAWASNTELTGISIRCVTQNGESRSDFVTVNPSQSSASLQITSPNGREQLQINQPYSILWNQSGLKSVSIALYKNDQWAKWIVKDLIREGTDIGKEVVYQWTPLNDNDFGPLTVFGNAFKIYITGQKADGSGYIDDKSDAPFSFIATAQPSAPTLTFSVNPSTINSGQFLTLSWSSSNATSCLSTGNDTSEWDWPRGRELSGTWTSPTLTGPLTRTLSVSCTGPGGSVTKSVTVNVAAPQQAGSVTVAGGTVSPSSVSARTNNVLLGNYFLSASGEEDVLLSGLRFTIRAVGGGDYSKAATEIRNLVAVINDVSYPAVTLSSGLYSAYGVSFPDGVQVPKGGTMALLIRGDFGDSLGGTVDLWSDKGDFTLTGVSSGASITPNSSNSTNDNNYYWSGWISVSANTSQRLLLDSRNTNLANSMERSANLASSVTALEAALKALLLKFNR